MKEASEKRNFTKHNQISNIKSLDIMYYGDNFSLLRVSCILIIVYLFVYVLAELIKYKLLFSCFIPCLNSYFIDYFKLALILLSHVIGALRIILR